MKHVCRGYYDHDKIMEINLFAAQSRDPNIDTLLD